MTLHIPFEGACSLKGLTFYNEKIIIKRENGHNQKHQKKCKQDHNKQQDHDEQQAHDKQQAHDIKLMTTKSQKNEEIMCKRKNVHDNEILKII